MIAEHLMNHPEHWNFDYGAFGDPTEMFEAMDEYELHRYQHGAIAFIRHFHDYQDCDHGAQSGHNLSGNCKKGH